MTEKKTGDGRMSCLLQFLSPSRVMPSQIGAISPRPANSIDVI